MGSNKKYWKGLEELEQTPAFVENNKGEFSESIPVENVLNEAGLSTKTPRRDFLKTLGFGLGAVTLASCSQTPIRKAVPYIIKPEEVTPGIPNYYASSFNGRSVLVKTREGRPIALEVNTNSTDINQGTDAVTAAAILDLYDMSKLQDPQLNGNKTDWGKLDSEVKKALKKANDSGKEISLISRTINSPSTLLAIAKLMEEYETVNHIQVDAVSYTGIIRANEESFGRAVVPTYHLENANVVVSVAADFLGSWLDGQRHTQGYMKNRGHKSLKEGKMSRHIQFEAGLSLTGTNADVRIAVKPSEEAGVLISLYNEITGSSQSGGISGNKRAETAVQLAAKELKLNAGNSVVLSGSNDPAVQTLVNAINAELNAYNSIIDLNSFSKQYAGDDAAFAQFLTDAEAGKVGAAIFVDANPAYTYYKTEDVEKAIKKIDFTVSLSDRKDETASLVDAIATSSSFFESWSDASIREGFYTIVQPTINPLFNSRQVENSILAWAGDRNTSAHDFVKQNWEENILSGSDKSWKEILQTGFYDNTPSIGNVSFEGNVGTAISKASQAAQEIKGDIELHLYEPSIIRDGHHANNAYLQEVPDPVSKVTWDNYAAINPKFAEQLGVKEKGKIKIKANGYEADLPVLIQPGQAMGTISVALGYGRTKVGKAGDGVGVNAYPFVRHTNGTNLFAIKASAEKTAGIYELAQTQTHHTIEGRNIIRETTFQKYLKDPSSESGNFKDEHKTYDMWNKYESPGHKWVMAIDLNACTGCGACIVACNVENNVPVVGRDEVRRRREMHWIRIDRYYTIEEDDKKYTKEHDIKHVDDFENVSVVHQPMLCQHCDHAPCETVCPVLATVHSSEGLNHMAYNRCFGTRYCANNCPYKVRRFNWFNYWNDSRFDNYLNNEFTQLMLNPDVTARSRGVMEKCSMCIQRIQGGKLQAKMENRKLQDGDIKTACQAACPANAIVFGDLNDPNSEVSKALRNERVYYVLEEINVQPNIGYMTKVRNTFEA